MNIGEVLACFSRVTVKLIVQLLPWEAPQPVRIFDIVRTDVETPGEQCHFAVRLIGESSKMLISLISIDDARNLFMLLFLQAVDVAHAPYGPKCFLSFVIKLKEKISFSVLHGRFIVQLFQSQLKNSMSLKVELSPILPD